MIVSLTLSAQYAEHRTIDFGNSFSSNFTSVAHHISISFIDSIFEMEVEEEDEPFDFNVKEYLPNGFNSFELMFETYNTAYEYFFDDVDDSFDFDTKIYLTEGFDPYENVSLIGDYELLDVEEEDDSFDFNTKEYLPIGFNPHSENDLEQSEFELLNTEEDAPFDFDTVDYLPLSFDANN